MLTPHTQKSSMPAERRLLKGVSVHRGDVPKSVYDDALRAEVIAWDLETSGLKWSTDHIATCQILIPDVCVHIIHIGDSIPKHLKSLLESDQINKIFHHAMFDLRFMAYRWSANIRNISCTKISSKILSPSVEDHSLKNLVKSYLAISLNKKLQTSNWVSSKLSQAQIRYAATDVLYLPAVMKALQSELIDCNLWGLAQASFSYIPTRVRLDLLGSGDVFQY